MCGRSCICEEAAHRGFPVCGHVDCRDVGCMGCTSAVFLQRASFGEGLDAQVWERRMARKIGSAQMRVLLGLRSVGYCA